jgi:hypothetical protein
VVPSTGSARCDRTVRQPSVTYNTYLQAYLMTFICKDGWYYSTASSLDRQDWIPPRQFFQEPGPGMFSKGSETDENVVFFTPGSSSALTTGKNGYVLYASTPRWLELPWTLYARTFSFEVVMPPREP